jgi:RNA recognition motif-containing protein
MMFSTPLVNQPIIPHDINNTLIPSLENQFDVQEATGDQSKNQENIELLPPSNTLYINNLNEKVYLDELKQDLFTEFSAYGKVIDVIAKKNIRMRGQAFIIFESIDSAKEALQEMQGVEFYGKNMVNNKRCRIKLKRTFF